MVSFIFIKIISLVITKECNSQINAVSCSASSEFNNNVHSYPCENAIDKNPKSDWTTKGEGILYQPEDEDLVMT